MFLHTDFIQTAISYRPGSIVGISTGYRLDGPGIEFQWGLYIGKSE
jgi:hypothetical protein